MAVVLGGGGTLPGSNITPITIPQEDAHQRQLKNDESIQLLPVAGDGSGGGFDTYKILTQKSDTVPDYLGNKINTNQFAISANKLELVGLTGLTSDDLTEGATNKYLTSANFDGFFSAKDTDDLSEGVSNLYYTQARFNTDFGLKTSDDLTEGATNLYFTSAERSKLSGIQAGAEVNISDTDSLSEGLTNLYYTEVRVSANADVTANTAARHTHANKSLLDTYQQTEANLASAVSLKHTHSNKAVLDATEESFTTVLKNKYDGYGTTLISSVSSPLDLTDGILSHSNIDGNKHVPTNSAASQYDILASGATQGSYSWIDIETIAANSTIFEATPSVSTTKGIQSAYINTHVSNGTTDVNHLTDALLAYIDTGGGVPTHIASTLLHLPTITPTTDQGKFLWVNTSDQPEWTTSSTNIQTAGTGTYISATGDTITIDPIDLSDTNITAGDNISFAGNTLNVTQRAISTSPSSGATTTAIASSWAYTHINDTGAGAHIPTGGTSDQYIAGDGTIKDFGAASGTIYKITMGFGANGSVSERLADGATVFPSGWSGAVGGVTTDLVITHDTSSNPYDVVIYSDDGTDITKLMGSAPYSTVIGNQTQTELTIASLTTINEKIYIYIRFE